ncbi:mucoidy inhibitor A [Purpureocillium lavendulum]|uniref:Mucoidy inhibitor A n=1 Tax=Purpureocillium lavendulum TaxID=1247861 RepID=A0AB34FX26_9HYPO|nr:mucoidy inhibitor A [Purpureocillium lavendulum]
MDPANKLEFHVRQLPTRSVTLFPTRAQVTREINNLQLKPGTNEITVLGLTPTADPDSVRIETASSVVISDVLVESLPNRDIWQDIYPSDSDSESDDQDDWEEPFRWDEGSDLKASRLRLEDLRDAIALADEKIANAEARLKYLDAYGKTLDRKRSVPVAEGLDAYREERAKLHEDIMTGRRERREADREVTEHAKDLDILRRKDLDAEGRALKAWERQRKPKKRAAEKRMRERMERAKERARIHKEREDFWPRACHAVRITVEAGAAFTPGSSRRASVATTDVDVSKLDVSKLDGSVNEPEVSLNCNLLLTYVTSSAHWTPSYDLKLSTTTNTGVLSFEAELHNATSETWSNCRVSLSTSQATFSGLDDAVPELTPWHLGLVSRSAPYALDQVQQQIMRSTKERESTAQYKEQQQRQTDGQRPRNQLFGKPQEGQTLAIQKSMYPAEEEEQVDVIMAACEYVEGNRDNYRKRSAAVPPPPPPPPAPMAVACAAPASSAPKSRGGPGARLNFLTSQSDSLSTRSINKVLQRGERMDSLGGGGGGGGGGYGYGAHSSSDDESQDDESGDEGGSGHAGSTVEETGMTTSFDLPGLKTLAPKHASTKSPVARATFTGVAYSHTVVAKYKPVAFLQARLRNTSRMTLFRGRAGLTLDGSFLGKTTLPRCSPGADLTLGLGVDPAVKVVYAKPGVRRGTAGLFSKENTWVYTRSVLLHNTRAAAAAASTGGQSSSTSASSPSSPSPAAVAITVRDQVPISQDDKLRVEVLTPQGLSLGGGVVTAGAPGLEARDGGSGGNSRDWGRAAASLKRDGEVKWEVSLKAGRAVRLALEFAVAFPTGTYPFNDEREQ